MSMGWRSGNAHLPAADDPPKDHWRQWRQARCEVHIRGLPSDTLPAESGGPGATT
jgi:hypothetical protein